MSRNWNKSYREGIQEWVLSRPPPSCTARTTVEALSVLNVFILFYVLPRFFFSSRNTGTCCGQENAELLTEEGRLLQQIQGDDVIDYDIDAYATRLSEILDRKVGIGYLRGCSTRGAFGRPQVRAKYFNLDPAVGKFAFMGALARLAGGPS